MSRMQVIIVGGGKIGAYLAALLINEGHEPRIIEAREEIVARLQREFPSNLIIHGSGTSPDLLESVGVRQADVVAAVTGADETNLVVASLARFEFEVKRVICRVNNPKNAWLFTPRMGVDVALNQAELIGRLIAEEMSLGDMMTLLKLRRGQYALVEEKVHPDSRAVGCSIRDLNLPRECVIVAVIHEGKLTLPRGDTVLAREDEIIALSAAAALPSLADTLGSKTA